MQQSVIFQENLSVLESDNIFNQQSHQVSLK